MNCIKKILNCLILSQILLNPNHVFSQRHSISIYYSPQLTKSNYDISKIQSAFIENDVELPLPTVGYKYGLEYSLRLGKKSTLVLGFFDGHGGQRSRFSHIPDSLYQLRGGSLNELLYYSSSLSMGYRHLLLKNKAISLAFHGNLGVDLLRKWLELDVGFGRYHGELISGARHSTITGWYGSYSESLKRGLDWQLFRYELGLGLNAEFTLYKQLYLNLGPRINYYTKMSRSTINKTGDSVIASGDIYTLGLMTGLGIRF